MDNFVINEQYNFVKILWAVCGQFHEEFVDNFRNICGQFRGHLLGQFAGNFVCNFVDNFVCNFIGNTVGNFCTGLWAILNIFSFFIVLLNSLYDLNRLFGQTKYTTYSLMPCPFTGPKFFCARSKLYLHIVEVTTIL